MAQGSVVRQRLSAWLIDLVIGVGLSALFHLLGWAAAAIYWLFRDGLFDGQSIGKRVMGLKVALPNGQRCTFKASLIRNVLWVIPGVNLLMGLTGVSYLFRDSRGRHWGDRLADTRVVRA